MGICSLLSGFPEEKGIVPPRPAEVDPLTQAEKKVGAVIADCDRERRPISDDEFAYLKVVGELIGAAAGKAQLVYQLIDSYRQKEAMIKETSFFPEPHSGHRWPFPAPGPAGQRRDFCQRGQEYLSGSPRDRNSPGQL